MDILQSPLSICPLQPTSLLPSLRCFKPITTAASNRFRHPESYLQHYAQKRLWRLHSTIQVESSTWIPDESAEAKGVERQQLFNRIAPMYDNLNDWLSLGQHRIWKRMAVSWSGVGQDNDVLDICCGSGDLAFLLADRVGPRGKVTGLDFAREQLYVASQRQKDSPVASHYNMEWVQGDALNLPFADATFDAVTVGYGLRNVADIPQALREICRVLKKGHKASILDFNRPANRSVYGFEEWLLDNVVVPVATQYGLREEYAYLKTSIACFPTGKEQEKLAGEAGFSHAAHFEIAGSLMGVLVARK